MWGGGGGGGYYPYPSGLLHWHWGSYAIHCPIKSQAVLPHRALVNGSHLSTWNDIIAMINTAYIFANSMECSVCPALNISFKIRVLVNIFRHCDTYYLVWNLKSSLQFLKHLEQGLNGSSIQYLGHAWDCVDHRSCSNECLRCYSNTKAHWLTVTEIKGYALLD